MDRRNFLALSTTFTLSVPLATRAAGQENFKSDGLAALDAAMQKLVADGKVPGVTWLLAKDDDVAFGGAGAPMARDMISWVSASPWTIREFSTCLTLNR